MCNFALLISYVFENELFLFKLFGFFLYVVEYAYVF